MFVRRPVAVVLVSALAALALAGTSIASSSSSTVWLCRPGQANDPCTASLATTIITASGGRSIVNASPSKSTKFDCFYVYPTVSTESGSNADLQVQSNERLVAQAQASRFSTLCRVWAPMYRQETLPALLSSNAAATVKAEGVAYASLLAAWKDYLAHDNGGRPVIFIGHSQGAAMLIRLLSGQFDANATMRRQLVSAIILGGNVTVANGRASGGTFRNIPACTSGSQTGCVIAYSSFPSQPPAASLFGIPGQGVSVQSNQTATKGVEVLCVNPAALGGGSGALAPYFPDVGPASGSVTTPWVQFPGLYTATCKHTGDVTWLQVDDVGTSSDRRPRVTESAGPDWGYHDEDVNLALGNLLADVAAQEGAYQRAHH
jgi:hypothetical protein